MTTTSSRFFDELAKLMTNATGAAQGLRKEVDTMVQAQVERVLNNLELVKREELDVSATWRKRPAKRTRRWPSALPSWKPGIRPLLHSLISCGGISDNCPLTLVATQSHGHFLPNRPA